MSVSVFVSIHTPSALAMHISGGYHGVSYEVLEQMCRRRGLTLTEMEAEVR